MTDSTEHAPGKPSIMYQECHEIASVVANLLASELPAVPAAPSHAYSLARGSSDHAAGVIQRLMTRAALPMTTLPPSMLRESLRLSDSVVLAISQSGVSPDIQGAAQQCTENHVPVVAIVNKPASPLADTASHVVMQQAGTELAVAATKSVVCSVVAGALIANHWGAGIADLSDLPQQIAVIQQRSTDQIVQILMEAGPVIVIGRGSGHSVACEVALKIQELLRRPALAYSSAEVLHGPAGMIKPGFPVLALAVGAESEEVQASASALSAMGAQVVLVTEATRQDELASLTTLCWLYPALERACVESGLSPDKPANLQKETLTL